MVRLNSNPKSILQAQFDVLKAFSSLRILPRRLSLSTPGVLATIPMIRGTWGHALSRIDEVAYRSVFDPPSEQIKPLYILRPCPILPKEETALEWISWGEALRHDAALLRAWDLACGLGLGKERLTFTLSQVQTITPRWHLEDSSREPRSWTLDAVAWPLAGDPENKPCRIHLPSPLRILRSKKHVLVEKPTLSDLLDACERRISWLLGSPRNFSEAANALAQASSSRPSHFVGGRQDVMRWSARQRKELHLDGVSGDLILPEGPGPAWPILAAAQWLHAGKASILGLGQVVVLPYEVQKERR